ncbi:YhcN/YlaJ family sporulation lipoprotein [Paenibacillus sp. 1P07SE]|uniref:YhcN/YlaJ family sporulation lipoprotein n=1 Tax=Paenibacillus sp. 1P07SE TaxID=3132209 RepID=UPI0039A62549
MKHRFTWAITSLTLAAALVLPGCTQQNTTDNPANNVQQQARRTQEDIRELGQDVGRELGMQPNNEGRGNGEQTAVDMQKAEQIAAAAQRVPGVTRATAIVHNNDIIVGLDIEGNDQKRTSHTEQQVKKMIQKQHENYKVHVTTDRNLHGKIQTLQGNAMNGGPIEEFTHDVGMIVRDIANAVAAPFR